METVAAGKAGKTKDRRERGSQLEKGVPTNPEREKANLGEDSLTEKTKVRKTESKQNRCGEAEKSENATGQS